MRKLFLKLSIVCAFALAFVYAFGNYFTWFWARFGEAAEVRNDVRLYLLIATVLFAGLYMAKKVIGVILIILAVILLIAFLQFDILQLFNIVR